MSYGWIIDRDHLAEKERLLTGRHEDNAKGATGPSGAPDWAIGALSAAQFAEAIRHTQPPWKMFTFQMYDDDGILYYTGRMATDEIDDGGVSEEACNGPLDDFGMPNAGCTSIKYPGHEEMDNGS